jgi:hypothetical protein
MEKELQMMKEGRDLGVRAVKAYCSVSLNDKSLLKLFSIFITLLFLLFRLTSLKPSHLLIRVRKLPYPINNLNRKPSSNSPNKIRIRRKLDIPTDPRLQTLDHGVRDLFSSQRRSDMSHRHRHAMKHPGLDHTGADYSHLHTTIALSRRKRTCAKALVAAIREIR